MRTANGSGNLAWARVAASAAALILSGCGGTTDSGAADPRPMTPRPARPLNWSPLVSVSRGRRSRGIAVVTADNPESVGEFVTASANFLDHKGDILATEEQVESPSWVGQELVLPIWLDLSQRPEAKVASIDVSVAISDHGPAKESREKLEPVEASELTTNQFGKPAAAFTLTNDTSTELQDFRVGVVCYDPTEQIIGGGSDYPELSRADCSGQVNPRGNRFEDHG